MLPAKKSVEKVENIAATHTLKNNFRRKRVRKFEDMHKTVLFCNMNAVKRK